jgi:hypothetical protein
MEKYFFESKKSDNFIELRKDNEGNIWIEKYYIDKREYDYILEFCQIINNAFETIKNRGGKMHSQYVSRDDWNNFLKNDDRWELIQECDDEINYISCDIDVASKCIIDAFLGEEKI